MMPVEIQTPPDGAVLPGVAVLTGTLDPDGPVDVYAGDTLAANTTSTEGAWFVEALLPPGEHVLTARAGDAASAPVTVTSQAQS